MTEKWKDIFIIITLGVIAVLATSWLIDILLIDGLNVDKGFLGSVLGGIIGTLGVIGTTYFLIEANNKAAIHSADLQDKQIREREYTMFVLKQIEEVQNLLDSCSRLINKDAKLIQMVAETYQDSRDFRQNNLSTIDDVNQEIKIILLDRDAKFIEHYKALEREEHELRFEIIEKIENIRNKSFFIPDINNELNEVEEIINTNLKYVQDHYTGASADTELAKDFFINFRTAYHEKEYILKEKLKEHSLTVRDIWIKPPN
ncbi:MAG: hypothetical protein ABS935_03100 [Solibacillus sp.]|uniref:hypothetical protein n=1 Tax=Solibacillus sp. TaxID=1909654 RepID=UPI0033147D85